MAKYRRKEGKVLIKWVYSLEGSKYFISIPHFPLMKSSVNFYDVEFIRWLRPVVLAFPCTCKKTKGNIIYSLIMHAY